MAHTHGGSRGPCAQRGDVETPRSPDPVRRPLGKGRPLPIVLKSTGKGTLSSGRTESRQIILNDGGVLRNQAALQAACDAGALEA
eukprot:3378122-Prymnesium_polylepis.1